MARKARWEDLAESELGPYGKQGGSRWARVLAGLLFVAGATFVFAYYLPLYRAHAQLSKQYRDLGDRTQTLTNTVQGTERNLKTASARIDELQAERDQRDGVKHQRAEQIERVRTLLSTKLDKYLKKGTLALVSGDGTLLVGLDAASLFLPQKLDLTPAAQALLCDVAKTSEPQAVTVRDAVGESSVAQAALAKSYPSTWAWSAARAAAVAQALEGGCSIPAARISATGGGKHDPWAAQLASSKLPADRVVLELTLR